MHRCIDIMSIKLLHWPFSDSDDLLKGSIIVKGDSNMHIYTFVFNNEKNLGWKGLKFSTKMKSEFPGHMHILNNDSLTTIGLLNSLQQLREDVLTSCYDKQNIWNIFHPYKDDV